VTPRRCGGADLGCARSRFDDEGLGAELGIAEAHLFHKARRHGRRERAPELDELRAE